MAKGQPKLSAQQIRFCEEYAKDRNGVRSAYACGFKGTYPAANEYARGQLQKPVIRDLLRRIWGVQSRRLKTAAPEIVREWAILGTSDLTDYAVDDDGRLVVAPGVPRSALRAVKKFKQTRTERRRGESVEVEHKTEIELHGKEGPLAKLYEHLHGDLPGEKDTTDAAGVLSLIDTYLAARQSRPGRGGGTAGDAEGQAGVDQPAGGAGGGVHQPGG
jgi:hypothetical protein